MLIKRRHFDVGAESDAPGIRWIGTGQHVDQRGLAGAVRSDDADAVAALYADREAVDDPAITI